MMRFPDQKRRKMLRLYWYNMVDGMASSNYTSVNDTRF